MDFLISDSSSDLGLILVTALDPTDFQGNISEPRADKKSDIKKRPCDNLYVIVSGFSYLTLELFRQYWYDIFFSFYFYSHNINKY